MFDFMATRLRGETKDMEVRIEGISEELKALAAEHEDAALALHTTTAQKLRTAAVGNALARHLESERAARSQKLARLRATLADQQARMQDFDEREARRQTMSGTVAQSDLDEDGEDRLKQLFLVRKVYNNMLTRRLRDDQRRTDKLANAYQRIRAATGLDDVDAIVSKFRTRDSTFASLQAQMKSARDRVDALLAERRALVWALDEARTTGAASLEVRALYNNVEEADRRIADANRRSRESRERCHRLNVLLEECRACVAKLLDRVGCDSSVIAGVVADLAALDAEVAAEAAASGAADQSQRRGSIAGGGAARRRASGDDSAVAGSGGAVASPASSPLARRHERLVSAEALGDALSTLEQRVGQLLAHLAAVFEREEVLVATTAKAKGGASTAGGAAAAAAALDATSHLSTSSSPHPAPCRQEPACRCDVCGCRVWCWGPRRRGRQHGRPARPRRRRDGHGERRRSAPHVCRGADGQGRGARLPAAHDPRARHLGAQRARARQAPLARVQGIDAHDVWRRGQRRWRSARRCGRRRRRRRWRPRRGRRCERSQPLPAAQGHGRERRR